MSMRDLSGSKAAEKRRLSLESDVARFIAGGGKIRRVTGSAFFLQLQKSSKRESRRRYANIDLTKYLQRTDHLKKT